MKLRLPIRILRWVFLALYAVIVVALCWLGTESKGPNPFLLILGGAFIAGQILFLFGAGTFDLCKPIRRRRLLLPVAAAAAMMAVLVGGLILALSELFNYKGSDWVAYLFWGIVAASWAGYAFLFYVYARCADRFAALKHMTQAVLAGSLLELLAVIPAHIVVSRRPGCFVGLATMIGILAGCYVMLWSFGPGIALLFLKDRRAAEASSAPEAPK